MARQMPAKNKDSRKRKSPSNEPGFSSEENHDPPAPSRSNDITRSQISTQHPTTIAHAKQNPDTRTSFASLGVSPWLVASLAVMAIKRPTSIQASCIPPILSGRDCIGGSKTGSGKTAAFAVPILQKWAEDPVGIFAVILTPTR